MDDLFEKMERAARRSIEEGRLMYWMQAKDKQELDAYRALGPVEEIRRRLESPYPEPEEGYAPMPSIYSGPDFPDGMYSGLLEEEET